MSQTYKTDGKKILQGDFIVAPDKSISHRALIFSALATGESQISNLLVGEDVLRTFEIITQLGVQTNLTIEQLKENPEQELLVKSAGFLNLKEPKSLLYCGNSGTTMRLLLGLLAGLNFSCDLTGDESLNKRPMERVTKPLSEMGASFETVQNPEGRIVKTCAHNDLKDFTYVSKIPSAQVKSSLLLCALTSGVKLDFQEPNLSRNHSELMLQGMGANLQIDAEQNRFVFEPVSQLNPLHLKVPADISSAAFFMVAGLLCKGSQICLKSVNLNPTRTGILDVLKQMNANLVIENESTQSGELVGDILIQFQNLKNTTITKTLVPRLIDEIPILALLASQSEGVFEVQDAKELRVKESDRIKSVVTEFKKLGITVNEKEDGFVIHGPQKINYNGEVLKTYHDHRMAMTFCIAGLLCDNALEIDDVSMVQTSFPNFFDLLNA